MPQGEAINATALLGLFRQIIANNRAGGWRKLKQEGWVLRSQAGLTAGSRCKDEGMPFVDNLPAPPEQPCQPNFVLPPWAE